MRSHLIHRQSLELTYADESKAREEFNGINAKFYDILLPTIEEVFDEYAPGESTIRIETVEIDLVQRGTSPNWEELKSQLKQKLSDQLVKEKIDQRRRIDLKNSSVKASPIEKERLEEPSSWDEFLYILENGVLPWWSSPASYPGFEPLLSKLIEKAPNQVMSYFQKERIPQNLWDRLVYQSSLKNIEKLISLTSPAYFKTVKSVLKSYAELIAHFSSEALEFEIELKKLLLAPLAKVSDEDVKTYLKLVKNLSTGKVIKASKNLQIKEIRLILELLISSNANRGISKFSTSQKKLIGKSILIKQYPEEKTANPDKIARSQIEEIIARVANQISKETLTEKKQKSSFEKTLNPDESLLVSNAGIVLFAAFLPPFFKALGYLDGKQFTNEKMQFRAALLLQSFLQLDGVYEETELVLNKLLCGIPLSQPIPNQIKLTEQEETESQNLLDSMVAHWTALKSSSGRSLAQGFLAREGSLWKVEKGYQLHIERSAIDILINSLPWTLSIIKLPWMDETLFTEW